MEMRLQKEHDDNVLEITETKTTTQRLSENNLLRQKQYLEQSITNFQTRLSVVNTQLGLIANAKNEDAGKV